MDARPITPDLAIQIVAQSVNIWLASTGAPDRVSAHDIVVTWQSTPAGNRFFLAFAEERPAAPGVPINRQDVRK